MCGCIGSRITGILEQIPKVEIQNPKFSNAEAILKALAAVGWLLHGPARLEAVVSAQQPREYHAGRVAIVTASVILLE